MKGAVIGLISLVLVGTAACGQARPSVAPPVDLRIEQAVSWAEAVARNNRHGYSQGAVNAEREKPYTGSREGPDYDCSSFVYHAFQRAGFPVIAAWRRNPACYIRYRGRQATGDADTVWADLMRIGGFVRYDWDDIKGNLRRGDILCRAGQHVAIYAGRGRTVEARGVENPIGGDWRTGDQGGEIDFYEVWGRGWTEVYRYVGGT